MERNRNIHHPRLIKTHSFLFTSSSHHLDLSHCVPQGSIGVHSLATLPAEASSTAPSGSCCEGLMDLTHFTALSSITLSWIWIFPHIYQNFPYLFNPYTKSDFLLSAFSFNFLKAVHLQHDPTAFYILGARHTCTGEELGSGPRASPAVFKSIKELI